MKQSLNFNIFRTTLRQDFCRLPSEEAMQENQLAAVRGHAAHGMLHVHFLKAWQRKKGG